MTNNEQNIIDLIKSAQHYVYHNKKYIDDYNPFVRYYSGTVRDALKSKNPVTISCVIHDIERVLGIINPKLRKEIDWFNKISYELKRWVNDRILTHRALGIKNDNH